MKIIKIYKYLTIAVLMLTIVSCVKNDEYDVPSIGGEEPDITVNSDIQAIKSALKQNFEANQESKMTFDGDSDLVISGYVVSSDLAGNFFKSIVIQDAPENPTNGIEILIDKPSLFESFEIGRKVYIKMAGLSVSYEDGDDNVPFGLTADGSSSADETIGRYTIGMDEGGFSLDEISLFTYLEAVLRSLEIATIVPSPVAVADITEEHINTFIQLNDMQFLKDELGKTFSGEPSDSFDGFRSLISCTDEYKITLQTSTFADFSSYTLPEEVGTMNVVLAKDFRADFLVYILNSPIDLDFLNVERCDPIVLECTGTSGGGSVIYSENFEGFSDYATEGWVEEVVSGTTDWFISGFGGNTYSRISAFRSGDTDGESWLITPSINLDTTTGEELTFDVQASYDNGVNLTVFISTDFTGDPETATWQLLDANIPSGPSGGFGSFQSAGSINISCLDGNVHVGFLYKGIDPNSTTRYHIDNIEITGN